MKNRGTMFDNNRQNDSSIEAKNAETLDQIFGGSDDAEAMPALPSLSVSTSKNPTLPELDENESSSTMPALPPLPPLDGMSMSPSKPKSAVKALSAIDYMADISETDDVIPDKVALRRAAENEAVKRGYSVPSANGDPVEKMAFNSIVDSILSENVARNNTAPAGGYNHTAAQPTVSHSAGVQPKPTPQESTTTSSRLLGGAVPEIRGSTGEHIEVDHSLDSIYESMGSGADTDAEGYVPGGILGANLDVLEELAQQLEETSAQDDQPGVASVTSKLLGGAGTIGSEQETLSSAFNTTMEEEDVFEGFRIDEVLADAFEIGASDIHIYPDSYVDFSILGKVHHMEKYGVISAAVVGRSMEYVTTNVSGSDFAEEYELDTSYKIKTGPAKGRRLRLSVGYTERSIFMVFRTIPNAIPSVSEMEIPDEVMSWTEHNKGLVLINGSTGTGKTTTSTSILRHIQSTKPVKIYTIENPVEFIYPNDLNIPGRVVQREVGLDTHSFARAMKSILRNAADIALIGEVRDQDEIRELLKAVETGHLAFSTLHADSAPAAIDRILTAFTGEAEQHQILSTLSEYLIGMMNQVLVMTEDGKGRFAVREVLTIDDEVSELIRNGDVRGIKKYQMDRQITLEHELLRAVRNGRTSMEMARLAANNIRIFDSLKESGDY